MISLGLCSWASRSTWSKSIRPSSARTPYCTALNHLPDMAGLAPWVRWPPASRDMPRMVSPGESRASLTAPLAWAPECGWTLAKPQSNSRLARSIASGLGDVDMLAAAIVALARVALGVLVGQHRALRLEHGAADDVLAGDQLDLVLLAAELGRDGGRHLRIDLGQGSARRTPASAARWSPPLHLTSPPRSPCWRTPLGMPSLDRGLFERSLASDRRQLQFRNDLAFGGRATPARHVRNDGVGTGRGASNGRCTIGGARPVMTLSHSHRAGASRSTGSTGRTAADRRRPRTGTCRPPPARAPRPAA